MFVSKTIADLKDTGTRLAQHARSFFRRRGLHPD